LGHLDIWIGLSQCKTDQTRQVEFGIQRHSDYHQAQIGIGQWRNQEEGYIGAIVGTSIELISF
jgi:hypothetical protein